MARDDHDDRGRDRSRSPDRRGRGRRSPSPDRQRRPSPDRNHRRARSPSPEAKHNTKGNDFRRVRSATPERVRKENRPDGGQGGGGKGSGKDRAPRERTTGKALPKMNSIHKATIVSCKDYGSFCKLGDGSQFKDGMLHISKLSNSRVEKVQDVVEEGDVIWVKVVNVQEEEGKYSLDMRYVGQKDGEDKDPHNMHADSGGAAKGKGKAEPIRIGAVQATTCTRCGSRGHTKLECFGKVGEKYDMVEETAEDFASSHDPTASQLNITHGHDPKVVKEALKAFLKQKAGGGSSSSSSSSSSSDKKKKSKKKLKKQLKKLKKKEKKASKKAKKGEKEVGSDVKEGKKEKRAKERSPSS